jgi:endonuclease/exonuclease/phosphatase family metal-dependent hydrolase
MIPRKSSAIKRFLTTLSRRLLKTALLLTATLLISFVWIQLGRNERAVTIQSPEDAPEAPARAPDTLRLLTYNIAHARGPALGAANTDGGGKAEKTARLHDIGNDIRGLGLDIVFLQEVDFNTWWSHGIDQAAIIAETAGFPYIVRQRTYDTGIPGIRRYDFGNVLLSRLPIEGAERIRLDPYSTWESLFAGNHDALVVRIRLGGDEIIRIIGAHLEYRSEDTRVEAAEALLKLQRRDARPLILLGDLNSTPPGFPESQASRSGQNTIELLESFGILQRRPKRGQASHLDFTFPTVAPRRIIDWILPDTNWHILEYRVLRDIRHSDHLPVLCTVKRR